MMDVLPGLVAISPYFLYIKTLIIDTALLQKIVDGVSFTQVDKDKVGFLHKEEFYSDACKATIAKIIKSFKFE